LPRISYKWRNDSCLFDFPWQSNKTLCLRIEDLNFNPTKMASKVGKTRKADREHDRLRIQEEDVMNGDAVNPV